MAPERMKNFDLATNSKEIVEFHLNLDLPDTAISKDFLFAMQPGDIGTYVLKRRYLPQAPQAPQEPNKAPHEPNKAQTGGKYKLYKISIQ